MALGVGLQHRNLEGHTHLVANIIIIKLSVLFFFNLFILKIPE